MINVGIVDDHAIVRTSLTQYLSDSVDMRVTGVASNGLEAIDLVNNNKIDVLVMDISMPGYSGIDAMCILQDENPDVNILVLSGYPVEHYAVNVFKHGAKGFLGKECDPSEIMEAIRVISLGNRYITPQIADLLAHNSNKKGANAPHELLSEREFQIFLKLARGETATVIAKQLEISIKTVSTYRTRLMEKMALTSNSDLTYYAIKNRLIN